MRNNVYIGNRYVPIFADPVEWDNLRVYEPLTIVTYQGTAYTSKKTVPVGTALSNTEYWVVTGNYNAQVEEYRQEVADLSDSVNGLTTRVGNAETYLDEVRDTVYADDVIILGDSYGVDSSAGGNSWASQVQALYPGVFRSTVGGVGFASDYYIAQNYLSLLQGLTIAHPENIKKILVIGGANDGNLVFDGTATLVQVGNRIDEFINYAKTNFPNAKVEIAFVGWYRKNQRFSAYNNVRNVYRIRANSHLNSFYNGKGDYIMHDNSNINSTDFIHPVQKASDELGRFAIACISGGDYSYIAANSCTVTPDSSVASISSGLSFKCDYEGDICRVSNVGSQGGYSYDQFTLTTDVTKSDGNPIVQKIGTISGTPVGGPSNPITYPVNLITGGTGEDVRRGITGVVTIQNNDLWLTIHNPLPNGQTFKVKVVIMYNAGGCALLSMN